MSLFKLVGFINPPRIIWSAKTIAVTDSATVVTLGQMHGSCLPVISRVVVEFNEF